MARPLALTFFYVYLFVVSFSSPPRACQAARGARTHGSRCVCLGTDWPSSTPVHPHTARFAPTARIGAVLYIHIWGGGFKIALPLPLPIYPGSTPPDFSFPFLFHSTPLHSTLVSRLHLSHFSLSHSAICIGYSNITDTCMWARGVFYFIFYIMK
ncbi:hypothetical protein C8J57DRAFT_100233 [Mycena rebaudengoi]|nr:hypothetical protein C8J57DRAFT_100233 [Mycena rebaudengoi]